MTRIVEFETGCLKIMNLLKFLEYFLNELRIIVDDTRILD